MLRNLLLREGLSVAGLEENQLFRNALLDAGGVSNKALRAWARSKFGVNVLIKTNVYEDSRDLGTQSYGHKGVEDILGGAYRSAVRIMVETIDLRTGEQVLSLESQGSAFAKEEPRAQREALTKEAAQAAKAIRQKPLG